MKYIVIFLSITFCNTLFAENRSTEEERIKERSLHFNKISDKRVICGPFIPYDACIEGINKLIEIAHEIKDLSFVGIWICDVSSEYDYIRDGMPCVSYEATTDELKQYLFNAPPTPSEIITFYNKQLEFEKLSSKIAICNSYAINYSDCIEGINKLIEISDKIEKLSSINTIHISTESFMSDSNTYGIKFSASISEIESLLRLN